MGGNGMEGKKRSTLWRWNILKKGLVKRKKKNEQ